MNSLIDTSVLNPVENSPSTTNSVSSNLRASPTKSVRSTTDGIVRGTGIMNMSTDSLDGMNSPPKPRRVYPDLRVDTTPAATADADRVSGAVNSIEKSKRHTLLKDDSRPWVSSESESDDSPTNYSLHKKASTSMVGGVWGVASALVGATLSVFRKDNDDIPPTSEELGIDDVWKGSTAPPTDAELENIGLGFATLAKKSPAYANVKHDIDGTINAMRTGLTPRRAQTPQPPNEVKDAVKQAKARSGGSSGGTPHNNNSNNNSNNNKKNNSYSRNNNSSNNSNSKSNSHINNNNNSDNNSNNNSNSNHSIMK
jgi:hypothetical protein